MTPLESIAKVAILLLLVLPIVLVVLVRIFEDCPPTKGWLIAQALLMLGVPILLAWLSLFLITKPVECPRETSLIEVLHKGLPGGRGCGDQFLSL